MLVRSSDKRFNRVYAVKGKDASVVSSKVYRCRSASSSEVPFGPWSDGLVAPRSGEFIWSRIEQYLSDGSKLVMYNVTKCSNDDIKPYTFNGIQPSKDLGDVSIKDLYSLNHKWRDYHYEFRDFGSHSINIDISPNEKFMLLAMVVSASYADVSISDISSSAENILFQKNIRTVEVPQGTDPVDRTASVALPISFDENVDTPHTIRVTVTAETENYSFISWNINSIIASK